MADFRIRRNRDEDDEAVKEIFTLGMIEHVPACFMHLLKQALVQIVLMCTFCALLTSSKSLLLPADEPAGIAIAMADFRIRRYRDEDDEAVKEIFTLGMIEHVPACFMHLLKQALVQIVLMCTFCALLTSSKSLLLPVLAVLLMLTGLRQMASYMFRSYVKGCLKEDLACIRETYMEKRDSCFWVVESEGRVVATVACQPCPTQPECLVLKRMSVRRTHRGLGIGKALCQAVADFTRERGYPAVVLSTSMIQTDAQKLYEHFGYTKIREFTYPSLMAKLSNFNVIEYRLELQERKM